MTKGRRKLRKLIPVEEAFARWEKNPKFRSAYGKLEEEFAPVAESLRARATCGLNEEQLRARTK